MLPPSRKSFLLFYALLVGLPLLGLVGILAAGRSLGAPVSVGGAWDLQVDLSVAQAQSCAAWLGSARPLTLNITQSGRYLTLTLSTLGNVSIPATLDGTRLATDAASPTSSKIEGGCIGRAGLGLKAMIDPNANPRVITGVLSVNGCPSCGSVSFRAKRQVLPTGNRGE